MRLRSTLVTVSTVVFGLALGGFLGYFLGSIFNTAHAENDGYIEPIMDDVNEINERFDAFLNGRNIEDVDLTTSGLSVSDIYNVANYKMNQHDKVFGLSKVLSLANNSLLGKVQTDIFVCYMKYGNSFLIESTTASTFVNSSNRFVWADSNVDETVIHHTGNVSAQRNNGELIDATPIFPANSKLKRSECNKELDNPDGTTFTQEDIVGFYGRGTNVPTVFQVSNDTVLTTPIMVQDQFNGDETATSSFTKKDDGYVITLCLDPQKAVINYAKQMGFENPAVYDPLFEAIIIEYQTTKDLTITQKRVHEKEYVYPAQTNGGETPTINSSVDYFVYDDEVKVSFPEITDRINYSLYWEMAKWEDYLEAYC